MNKLSATLSLLAFSLAATVHAAPKAGNNATEQTLRTTAKAGKNGFSPMLANKRGSGVGLAYRIDATPTVGSPLTIRIQMNSASDAELMLRAGEGLELLAPNQVLQSKAGQMAEHTVTVVPQAEGRFYLNIFSLANGRGSATAIAVQVGKGVVALKPAGKLQVTPSGERVISVPVQ
jgi:hypothetical protein